MLYPKNFCFRILLKPAKKTSQRQTLIAKIIATRTQGVKLPLGTLAMGLVRFEPLIKNLKKSYH